MFKIDPALSDMGKIEGKRREGGGSGRDGNIASPNQ